MAKAHAETPASVSEKLTTQPLIVSGKSLRGDADRISPFITEVIRLLDAKLDVTVIKSYIRNTPMTYNPSATELIALQQHRAGTETLLALVQRAAEAGARTSPALPTAPYAAFAPIYRYVPQTVYQAAPENYSSPSETSYSTNYEASASSPVYYAIPAYYTGVGLPGFGPDTRRPALREERGHFQNPPVAHNSEIERGRTESSHSSFASPAAHVAPTSAHGAARQQAGHGGGPPGGRPR